MYIDQNISCRFDARRTAAVAACKLLLRTGAFGLLLQEVVQQQMTHSLCMAVLCR